MGMSYDELYDSTPRTFNNILIGFNLYQEQLTQDSWEQTRIIAHCTISPHSKKRLKPKEVLPFPWDNKTKPKGKVVSNEHIQDVIKRYDKKLNK